MTGFDTYAERDAKKSPKRLRYEARTATAQALAYRHLAAAADDMAKATLTVPDMFASDGETAVYAESLRHERDRLKELAREMDDDAAYRLSLIKEDAR